MTNPVSTSPNNKIVIAAFECFMPCIKIGKAFVLGFGFFKPDTVAPATFTILKKYPGNNNLNFLLEKTLACESPKTNENFV